MVDVSFGWWHHRLDRSKIIRVDKINVHFGVVLGIGIRIGPQRENIWNAQFGDAVKIESRTQKQVFVFISDHPDDITRRLKK